MELQFDGALAGAGLDVRDVEIIAAEGGPYLAAASGANGGLRLWRLSADGQAVAAGSLSYGGGAALTAGALAEDGRGGLVFSGSGQGQIWGCSLDGGQLQAEPAQVPGCGAAAVLAGVALSAGRSVTYVVAAGSGQLTAWKRDVGGAVTDGARLEGSAAAYMLGGGAELLLAEAGGGRFLLASCSAIQGVRLYRADPFSGNLAAAGEFGTAEALGSAAPVAMAAMAAAMCCWPPPAATR